jgi:ADP-ribose pyrophosphatase YjhB (NUDIX family)
MNRRDPREEYELHERQNEHEVDAEQFSELQGAEVYQSGWVTIAAVLDDEGRLLLIYDEDHGSWVVPGGTVQPGETLREAVVREVREESGVDIVPERPHSFVDVVCRDGEREMGFNVVGFGARAETTLVGTDLGVEDEAITDAAWFESPPENLYQRGHAVELLTRVRGAQ